MTAKKIISTLSASAKDARQFVCPAETSAAENVVILFQDDLAAKKLELVRLAIDDLPKTHRDEPIDWLINFGIREQDTENYVDVPYTLFIVPRPDRRLVIYDGTQIKEAPIVTNESKEFAGRIAVKLAIGDPGTGWDGQT